MTPNVLPDRAPPAQGEPVVRLPGYSRVHLYRAAKPCGGQADVIA
jgi:hypothetical protein